MIDAEVREKKAAAPAEMSRTRMVLTGLGLIALGMLFAWFALVRHVEEARQTGVLEYSYKALIGVPCLLYAGLGLMVLPFVGDRSTRKTDAQGRTTRSAAGWLFLLGIVGSFVAMCVWWTHYTHAAGFQAF